MNRRRLLTALFAAAVLGLGTAAVTVRAYAAGESSGSSPAGQGAESPDLSADADSSLYEFLETSDGRRIYLVLPENYDPSLLYPSVYLMPADGFSARQYLEDGIAEYLKDLMQTEQVLDMVFVLPQFGQQTAGEDGNDFSAQSVCHTLTFFLLKMPGCLITIPIPPPESVLKTAAPDASSLPTASFEGCP